MIISPERTISLLIKECYANKFVMLLIFIFISTGLLGIGSMWSKKYTSFVTIMIDNDNILQPLMRGTAETTSAADTVANAREIIYGEKIIDQIMEVGGWLESDHNNIELERIKNDVRSRIQINDVGENLLRIQYTDNQSTRAYITTKHLGDLFIEEGEKAKVRESQSAYNFIHQQVEEYKNKLIEIEEELREFRSQNPEVRPDLESDTSNRISRLQQEIETTELTLREASIRKDSLENQLSGEVAIAVSQTRENQFRRQIAELQQELEQLRLDYKETYPDIIRVKNQIQDIKNSLINEIQAREEARRQAKETGNIYIDESVTLNPLYQQIRGNLSDTETEIAALKERIKELNKMLESEYSRSSRISSASATLSKLTRNYDVNLQIYEDLLRRLENSRVSKNLDVEQQGFTYKIQEPAKMPLLPTGIRYIHFVSAGLVLGTSIPIGLIFLMIQIDPRIRLREEIESDLNIPVLGEVGRLYTAAELRREKTSIIIIVIGVLAVLALYGYVSWLKYNGVI